MKKIAKTKKSDAKFWSIAKFLHQTGHSTLSLYETDHVDEKTGEEYVKLSIIADDDTFYKCQQSLDPDKRMAWLIPVDKGVLNVEQACLVNVERKFNGRKTTVLI